MTALLATLAAIAWPLLRLEWIAADQINGARSIWLLALVAVGGAWAAALGDWWLTAMAAWFVWRWRTEEECEAAGTWVGIGATWYLALAVPEWGWAYVLAGWQAAGCLCVALALNDWWRGQRVHAWLGQRTFGGAFLALVMALSSPWTWPVYGVGLWLSGPSWLAVGALAAASVVRWPWTGPLWVALVVLAGLGIRLRGGKRIGWVERWTPRGDSLDSLWMRTRGLALAWRWVSRSRIGWVGTRGMPGGYGVGVRLRSYALRAGLPTMDSFHCEPVQHAVEYGWIGAVAVLAFAWRVGSGVTLGDPWSAAVVGGAVLASGTIFCRVGPVGLCWLVACAQVAR